MSEAINEITTFIDQLKTVPEILVQFVSNMPVWFSFSIGLSVVLGIVVIIWRIIS